MMTPFNKQFADYLRHPDDPAYKDGDVDAMREEYEAAQEAAYEARRELR